MAFGNRQKAQAQQITGPDILMVMADNLEKSGDVHPGYARMFAAMLQDCFAMTLQPNSAEAVAVARRPLEAHEQAAMGVVFTALGYARDNADQETFMEVGKVGLSLAIKFEEYLAQRQKDATA
jgi:hypothetical protein